MFNLIKKEEVMNIDLKDAKELELLTYQIAVMSMVVSCNQQLSKIKDKLAKVQKERENNE